MKFYKLYNNEKIDEVLLKGFYGDIVDCFSFKIPKINIGGFELNNVVVWTLNPEIYLQNIDYDIASVLGMDILRYFKMEIEVPDIDDKNNNSCELYLELKSKYVKEYEDLFNSCNPDEFYAKYFSILLIK